MTKEQYLSIRASWKSFIAEGKHKKYKHEYESGNYHRNADGTGEWVKSYYWVSDLKDMHHYIYALLRKKDLTKAFTEEKIVHLDDILKYRIRTFERNTSDVAYFNRVIAPMLAPFGEQFKYEDLKALVQ